jgi:hypothetical protein
MTLFKNTIVGHILGTGLRAVGGPVTALLLPSRGKGDDMIKKAATVVLSGVGLAAGGSLVKNAVATNKVGLTGVAPVVSAVPAVAAGSQTGLGNIFQDLVGGIGPALSTGLGSVTHNVLGGIMNDLGAGIGAGAQPAIDAQMKKIYIGAGILGAVGLIVFLIKRPQGHRRY